MNHVAWGAQSFNLTAKNFGKNGQYIFLAANFNIGNGHATHGVAVGDFNQDGKLGIAANTQPNLNIVSVLLGSSQGDISIDYVL